MKLNYTEPAKSKWADSDRGILLCIQPVSSRPLITIQYPLAYEMDTAKKIYMCIRLGRAQYRRRERGRFLICSGRVMFEPQLGSSSAVGSLADSLSVIYRGHNSRNRGLARSHSFRGKCSWNNFYFLPSADSKKGSCRLLANVYVCALSSGNRQGISLSRKSVSRLIDNSLYVPWMPGQGPT